MRHALEGLDRAGQRFQLGIRGPRCSGDLVWEMLALVAMRRNRAGPGDRSALNCDAEVSELSPGV
jgi:hypothetical protein